MPLTLIPSRSGRRSQSWVVGLLGCLFILACRVSASSETDTDADTAVADVAESPSWQAAVHIAGFKPLYGVQEKTVTLDKRQSTCSSNGSNFCFGDSVNFCATCGICCGSSSSGYCCAADQICCGTACCASGQTCTNGECFLPLETVIVTSAALVTVSHVATQLVTVEQAVVSTSTIFSTTEITVSSGGTQTDIVYVTVTAATAAKRAAVVEVLEARHEPSQDGLWNTLSLFYRRFSFPWTSPVGPQLAPIQRRALRATQEPLAAISSSTVITTSITRTSDVTSFVSSTTTVPTSSIVLVTVFQTKTRVLDAQTTLTTTSTLTVTPKAPTTETVTKTATNPPSTSNTDTAPGSSDTSTPAPSTGSSSSGLSTGAIAGIAGGIGGAAVLILVVALLWWLHRRRNREPPHQDPSSYLEPYIPDMSSPIPPARTGTSPSNNRFGASAPHHDGAIIGAAVGAKNLDRYSNISGGPGAKKPVSPRLPNMPEAPGGEVYEADGTSRVAAPSPPQGGEIYEADSGLPQRQAAAGARTTPPYPVDAREMEGSPTSPATAAAGQGGGHQRNVSAASAASSGRFGGAGRAEELDGTGFSPVSEADGTERLRNTNPYRSPGAYRDF